MALTPKQKFHLENAREHLQFTHLRRDKMDFETVVFALNYYIELHKCSRCNDMLDLLKD